MRQLKKALAASCCVAMLGTGGAFAAMGGVITVGEGQKMTSEAETPEIAESIGVWGPIRGIEGNRILIDNISGNSSGGDMFINIAEDHTRVLDAVDGLPVALTDLKVGDFVYAYIGQVMTMSLPPQVTGEMIICNAPADFKVPEYVQIKSVEAQADGSIKVDANNGNQYLVPADTQILPYLTRNIVTIQDIAVGSKCMIWSDENSQAGKIVLFAR